MSIINRLKKLQKQTTGNDSEFCGCEKEIRNVVIYPGASGEPIREPAEDYPMPETCETCGKPNADPFHFTFTINPNVNLTGEA
jgi:hypothetical protein